MGHIGETFTWHCPFHKDRTPSCVVDIKRGTFHCFGCGKAGSADEFKAALAVECQKAEIDLALNAAQLANMLGVCVGLVIDTWGEIELVREHVSAEHMAEADQAQGAAMDRLTAFLAEHLA